MGAPYTSVSSSGYNANPPSDDGSATASNRVLWSTIKSKLSDVLKTFIESINTNVGTAFGKVVGGAGVGTVATNYTVLSSDQGKLLTATASSIVITTPDATVVLSPFVFQLVNRSTGTISLAGNGAQTVDGAASINIPPGCGVFVETDGSNWATAGQNFPSPVPSAYKNLAIKVATNTTVTVTADFVVTTNGSNFQSTAVNSTINLGTTGADALDTSTIAIDTFYAIFVIAKPDGTTKCLASTSATAPTMPTGYTFKARVGWVQTIHASATLYGTWQLGRQARYIVGLAQTATLPGMASSTSGSVTVPTWTAQSTTRFVPTTAGAITILLIVANGVAMAAPNNSYGAAASTSNPPPLVNASAQQPVMPGTFLLESSNIYWASNSVSGILFCYGWEDNI